MVSNKIKNMKQLLPLFLFLVPCLALAQYPSNGNQKITLGEQTTADGLIWRGVLADTGIITPSSDTSAYIILDTVNHRFYNYNRATNVWSVAGGGTAVTSITGGTGLTGGTITTSGTLAADTSFLFTQSDTLVLNLTSRFNTKQNTLISASNIKTINGVNILGSGNIDVSGDGGGGVTTFTGGSTGFTPNTATSGAVTLGGTLAVANGGTGASSFSPNNYLIRTNSSGIFDTSAIYEAGGSVGIGTATPSAQLNFVGDYTASGLQAFEMSRSGISRDSARFTISSATNTAGQFLPIFQGISNFNSLGLTIGMIFIGRPQEDNSSDDVAVRIDGRRKITGAMTTGAIVEFTNANVPLMRIMASGNVGIGQSTPTARLHLAQGTATASTAPLKFTSQGASLLNPVEAGAVEFNGTNLLFTPSTTRHTVNHGLPGSATLNFPSTLTMLSADLTITVTGAADGDVVSLGVPNAAVNANTSYSAWVSAANTVTVRFNNYSSGTVDPASGLFKVFVTK
jgi:hypothetical protein